ncbi:hypothetical protein Tco_0031173 [Tanacetum coccineum]
MENGERDMEEMMGEGKMEGYGGLKGMGWMGIGADGMMLGDGSRGVGMMMRMRDWIGGEGRDEMMSDGMDGGEMILDGLRIEEGLRWDEEMDDGDDEMDGRWKED